MWFFIVTTESNNQYIKDNYNLEFHSGDRSKYEGFVVDTELLDKLNKDPNINTNCKNFCLTVIPDKYQNNIEMFIEDFWDGDFSWEDI
jgi:hypothetical protein